MDNRHNNKQKILKYFLLKSCILLDFNKYLMYHFSHWFLFFRCKMFKFIKKANDNINIYNININFFVYFKNIKPNFKKIVSTFLSCSILYSQLLFSFIITQSIAQSIISTISIKKAYAFNDIIPPQNIKDNPVDHIAPDNSVNVPGGNNTHLDRTQNGTPMVNINNANADGISANYYKDFNVNDQNLILNNYKGEATNTQLGGAIYGNPNFNNPNGREADIILNEITTNRVSNIDGYVEVAGRRADIIIANPNGIMVGGAGFININRLSMITGKSLDGTNKSSFNQNGELNLFLLTDTDKNPNAIIQVVGRNITDNQGNIVAYNLGIDAQDVRYADLMGAIIQK